MIRKLVLNLNLSIKFRLTILNFLCIWYTRFGHVTNGGITGFNRQLFVYTNIGGYALPNYGETETEIEGQRETKTKKMERYRAKYMAGKEMFLFNSIIEGYALPNYGETETEIEGQRGIRTKN